MNLRQGKSVKISLTIEQRFEFINRIGFLKSTKESLILMDGLIDKLLLTEEETKDPNLALSFNQTTGEFDYNEKYDKLLEIELTEDIQRILKGE